jgi:nicotinamide riboside kinase
MSPQVQRIADDRNCDLYFLTGDEIPFVQDGARDGEHIRHQMHTRFEQELTRQRKRYILVQGDLQERMRISINAVDRLFQELS